MPWCVISRQVILSELLWVWLSAGIAMRVLLWRRRYAQKEARQWHKLYRQEPAAMIYDLDRWRIVYRRGYWPAGALPIEGGCNA